MPIVSAGVYGLLSLVLAQGRHGSRRGMSSKKDSRKVQDWSHSQWRNDEPNASAALEIMRDLVRNIYLVSSSKFPTQCTSFPKHLLLER
ncbi:hypothetical protein BCR34DRAFT_150994 [Clohesyomyces aquaticus]|uniref:Uncharacterized protein n=1 Tax=Clohesyomyces aquaticus TaxID=1231657 RepID=A0A1Y1YL19_9PLEO|nr:hypothetical protein BCR34DRAFT_150994 [Clohesyomyces aquaticus]